MGEYIMKCNFCEENGFVQVDGEDTLYLLLRDIMDKCDLDEISVVADDDTTAWLLYFAINDECYFGNIIFQPYDYEDAYITTICREYDENDEEAFEINVEKAKVDDNSYLATDCATFIQFDLPCKCEYIEDVMANNADFNPEFFLVGDVEEDEESEDDHIGAYTYADHIEDDYGSGDIYIESTSKELIDIIKEILTD